VKLINKSIKRTIGICLTLFLEITAISCAPTPATLIPQPPTGFLTYNDIVSNFAIPYPEDWEMMPKENIQFALVGFWDRQQDASVNSFYVMKAALPFEMDVEDYFESERGYFPGEYANYTPISTDTLTLNGKKAIRHTWTFTLDGDAFKYIRQYIVDQKTIWILEAGYPLESFDGYKSIYDTMMSGFYILS
jgi:hypothetical protein